MEVEPAEVTRWEEEKAALDLEVANPSVLSPESTKQSCKRFERALKDEKDKVEKNILDHQELRARFLNTTIKSEPRIIKEIF